MSGKIAPASSQSVNKAGSGIYVPLQEKKDRSFGKKGSSRIQSVKHHRKTSFAAAEIAQENQEKRADSFNTRRQSVGTVLENGKVNIPTIADLKAAEAHRDRPAERVALKGVVAESGQASKDMGLVTLDGTSEPEEPLLIRGPSGDNKLAMK